MVLNVAVRNLEKYRKNVEHTDRVPVSLWYSLCYPVNPGTLVKLGRPADEPPVVCRYKFQQVLTSRPRMYSLVLFERGGPYSSLSNGFGILRVYMLGLRWACLETGLQQWSKVWGPDRDDLTLKSGI